MDVDISATTQVSRPLPILEVSCSTNTCPENVSKLPIMNLSLENVTLAGEVLEAFGKVLGPKQGAYAVDSILSDVFDKWTQEQPTLTQLKEWASSIVVATKVASSWDHHTYYIRASLLTQVLYMYPRS